jgi:hypothetical protein
MYHELQNLYHVTKLILFYTVPGERPFSYELTKKALFNIFNFVKKNVNFNSFSLKVFFCQVFSLLEINENKRFLQNQ